VLWGEKRKNHWHGGKKGDFYHKRERKTRRLSIRILASREKKKKRTGWVAGRGDTKRWSRKKNWRFTNNTSHPKKKTKIGAHQVKQSKKGL